MKSFLHKKKLLRIIVWLIVFALALLCKFFNICEVYDFFLYLFLVLFLAVIILYMLIEKLPKNWQDLVATAIIYIIIIGTFLIIFTLLVNLLKIQYNNNFNIIIFSIGILLFPFEKIFKK